MKVQPKNGRYYDLIHVPHGHIPTPMTNLWSSLPIPIKQTRDAQFYFCPECGEPSFFKINYMCNWCEEDYSWNLSEWQEVAWRRYERRRRRKYFKEIFKRIEYLFLPIHVLLGKAWYVQSVRLHYSDVDCVGESKTP